MSLKIVYYNVLFGRIRSEPNWLHDFFPLLFGNKQDLMSGKIWYMQNAHVL